MNWRQFTVALVQALAWPSVVVAVLLTYRRRIAQLLGDNLRRLVVGPIEAEWEKAAEEVRATIQAVEAVEEIEAIETPSLADHTPKHQALAMLNAARALAEVDPGEAIRLGWAAVRFAIQASAEDASAGGARVERRGNATRWHVVNPGATAVLEKLHRLRNVAVGEPQQLTPEHARQYVDLIEDFIALLNRPPKWPREGGDGAGV